jgi:hypothetical protein
MAETLRGILNSGFRARGNFRKCVGEGANMTVRSYSTFGAKALAGIGGLPDTIADRSIPIRLRRRAPGEQIAEFFEEEWEADAAPIANGLADALTPSLDDLASARPTHPDGISDRAKDAWKALLAIADLAAGEWPDRARHAAQVLCGNPELDEQEIGIRLLGALRDAFQRQDTDKLMSHEFLEHLHAQEDEPWSDWSRGNPISGRRVADLLRPFDIRSKTIRRGEERAKGFEWSKCKDAFERYLPRGPGSIRDIRDNGSTKPETAPFLSVTNPQCHGKKNPQKPHQKAIVTDVTATERPTGKNDLFSVDELLGDEDEGGRW